MAKVAAAIHNDGDDNGKNAGKKSRKRNVVYSPEEQDVCNNFAKEDDRSFSAIEAKGSFADDMIALNDSLTLEDVFLKISIYPGVNCCPRHVRRCWEYYRMVNELRDQISPDLEHVDKSSRYELARLVWLDPQDAAGVINACIAVIIGEDMGVSDVKELIRKRLEEFGKIRKRPGKTRKKTGRKTGKKKKARTLPTVPTESDLIDFADAIGQMARPERVQSGAVKSSELRNGTTRILREILALVRTIPTYGQDEPTGNTLLQVADELRAIGLKLMGKEAA